MTLVTPSETVAVAERPAPTAPATRPVVPYRASFEKDLRITEYEIVRVTQKNDKLAQVQVKMSWYLDSEGTLRETSAARAGKITSACAIAKLSRRMAFTSFA